MPQAFSLQGSTDGIAWTTLSNAITTETNWHPGEHRHYPLAVTGSYAYYRLTVTSNNGDGGYCSFGELSLMTERVPAVLADATSHLSLGHAAATTTAHCREASSNVVFSTIPYLGQHLTGGAASALVFNYSTGVRHTSLRDATAPWHWQTPSVRTRVQFRGATSPDLRAELDLQPQQARHQQPAARAEQHGPQAQHAAGHERVDRRADGDRLQHGPSRCGDRPLDRGGHRRCRRTA